MWAYGFGVIFFGEIPNIITLIGAVCVSISIGIVSIDKIYPTPKDEINSITL